MKKLLIGLLALSSLAQAGEYCTARQKLEASIALAKEMNSSLDNITVIGVTPGKWTRMTHSNSGIDTVQVQFSQRRYLNVKSYEVSVSQIGSGADCTINEVREKN